MGQDWKELTSEASKLNGQVARALPEVARGFSRMAQAASGSGELSEKTKELIAIAISIAIRCESCIGLHVKSAIKAGVTREELLEMIGVAIYMGGGPSYAYGGKALEAFDQQVS